MDIYICIGSSCHLKGSYDIINIFKSLIKKHDLEDKVSLNASFCLGRCIDGVTIKIDEQLITGLSIDNAESIFSIYVLGGVV